MSGVTPPVAPPVTPANSKLKIPYNTPVARNADNDQLFGLDPKHTSARNRRYAIEAQKFFLGPMPAQDFLDDFLPRFSKKGMPSSKNAFKHVPEMASREQNIYTPLISALNGDGKKKMSRCPGFVFDQTSTREDIVGEARDRNGRPRAHLGYAELFFEVKKDPKQDFFTDPKPDADRASHQFILNIPNERTRQEALEALGQNVAYATEACARQHRTFYFSVSVSGSHARLIRWDRAGAIVTEGFDLHQHPKFLCEFLWRFSHSTDAQRGYDMTIEPASPEEEVLFRNVITTHVQEQLLEDVKDAKALKQAVDEHYLSTRVTAVRVYDESTPSHNIHRYLISRPVVSPLSMTSRATRGYWAVREDGRIAFLKDTWQCSGEDFEREGDILIGLHQAEVQNIPELLHHGNVPSQLEPSVPSHSTGKRKQSAMDDVSIQRSLTDQYLDAKWLCTGGIDEVPRRIVTPRVHYRIILGTVGYSLKTFRGTEELLYSTYCAYQG
ncbi:uncharacterized protein FIBRA_09084 [Fibroporia radiculosa]|uniref:Fungal-type protein kinase domain-containing protein n=1 Tax=Fibroporia radiculosa TaxID=599839 RepID=J4GXW8_9APHY|nr:uncharacterized protein FIBRA_09084 [Fibroporia radiculosa]CCM06785.1 predicted protein [Fibroporia radiculosa]